MSETKLLPCPFCGGEAIIDREDIFCDNCYLSMRIDSRVHNGDAETYDEARTQAINDWNTRKPMDNIVAELEKAKTSSNYEIEGLITRNGYIMGIDKSIDIVKAGGVE